MKKIVLIKILLSAAAVIGICAILNANLLLPWQREARKNKQAALEYVSDNYPEAIFVEAYYRTTKVNLGNPGYDQFVFELNEIKFPIFAEHGKVAMDLYWKSFAEHQLYDTYIKPFVESKNITAKFSYTTNDLQEFFVNNPNADISQFDGDVGFGIELYEDAKTTNPESIGWLYNFYIYCKENLPFSYTVTIICKGSSTIFSNESKFKNEAEFYNSFI